MYNTNVGKGSSVHHLAQHENASCGVLEEGFHGVPSHVSVQCDGVRAELLRQAKTTTQTTDSVSGPATSFLFWAAVPSDAMHKKIKKRYCCSASGASSSMITVSLPSLGSNPAHPTSWAGQEAHNPSDGHSF